MADTKLKILLLALLYLFSSISCEKHCFTFWTTYPDNSLLGLGIPEGHPKSNTELARMIGQDGEMTTSCISQKLGNAGYTWYVTSRMEVDLVNSKYKSFKMIRHVYDVEENKDGSQPPRKRYGANNPTKKSTRLRRRGFTKQDDAPRQLKFLSLPESAHNDLDSATQFVYDETAGKGVRIYFVDGGINPDSDAWKSSDEPNGREIGWIFAEPFSAHRKEDLAGRGPVDGHGSCTADLAAGAINGVAKRADITAVQTNVFTDTFLEALDLEISLDGMAQIYDEVVSRKYNDKAVVLLPFAWGGGGDGDVHWEAFQDAFFKVTEALLKKGVAVITGVPNGDEVCEGPPCIWGKPGNDPYLPDLITVGDADINDGSHIFDPEYRDDWVTIHGPGDDRKRDANGKDTGFQCAARTGEGNNEDVIQHGTSHASALIAGLMAYIKGHGFGPKEARQKLLELAYKRHPNGPKMPWNGVIP
ncbi:hypothetical protein LTR64_005496 [Lithohypha guttulata]|uniref:uncharacterized protein n=1 Tax=Lithohypha guttulata TaxID=1690604 RepID=UPI002DDE6D9A|nr:hypothetical protein LTR51_002712 [Lithohypha guttulata]